MVHDWEACHRPEGRRRLQGLGAATSLAAAATSLQRRQPEMKTGLDRAPRPSISRQAEEQLTKPLKTGADETAGTTGGQDGLAASLHVTSLNNRAYRPPGAATELICPVQADHDPVLGVCSPA